MKQSVILNTEQVTRLIETGSLVVVDIVKPQPPDNDYELYKNHSIKNGKNIHWVLQDEGIAIDGDQPYFSAPYALNSTVYVREKWRGKDGKPQSAATMPKSAARFFPVVEKVVCVRCQQILTNVPVLNQFSPNAIEAGQAFYRYITNRFGQSFWDANGWIFLTKLNLNK